MPCFYIAHVAEATNMVWQSKMQMAKQTTNERSVEDSALFVSRVGSEWWK